MHRLSWNPVRADPRDDPMWGYSLKIKRMHLMYDKNIHTVPVQRRVLLRYRVYITRCVCFVRLSAIWMCGRSGRYLYNTYRTCESGPAVPSWRVYPVAGLLSALCSPLARSPAATVINITVWMHVNERGTLVAYTQLAHLNSATFRD